MNENSVFSYKTVIPAKEAITYKEKGSKFLGFIFHVNTIPQIEQRLNQVKQMHPKARHWVYAYRLKVDGSVYKHSDDGEPSNSAGTPIFNQILSMDLTHILVIVVRYFGGTKLGIPGLIKAYKNTALEIINASKIITKKVDFQLNINVSYDELAKFNHLINIFEHTLEKQDMKQECNFTVRFNLEDKNLVINFLTQNNLNFEY